MDWDMEIILWPTIYVLLAVAAIFFIWAIILRNSKRKVNTWKEMLAIAAFCLVGSCIMAAVHSFDLKMSFLTRLGLVSVILSLYAFYSYHRNRSRK